MEDVGHPRFQEFALGLAKNMASRYGDHPAVLAFGLCNEIGAGFVSYSEEARRRFVR
jgi:beta-galactosidase